MATEMETSSTESSARSSPNAMTSVTFDDLLRHDLKHYCPASNLAFNEKIKLMQAGGEKVHHFAFGQAPFPIMEEMVDALRDHAAENSYEPVAGIPELRNGLVEFHRHYDNLDYGADQVVVAPGSKELIYLVMAVFNGDVLVVSPTWTTYKPQSKLAGRKSYVIQTSLETKWKVTPAAIDEVLKSNKVSANRMLIFCNPDNPTGVTYNDEQLKDLATYCRENNIIVVSDEIYGRLHYNQAHVSLAKYYPEGTILSAGFSKWASAGGWRLGYHIYPRELSVLHDAVKSAASHTYSCAPVPMQYAVAKTMKNKTACKDYITHTARIMKAVATFCYEELCSVGVTVEMPSGGYYMFPVFDNIRSALIARGVTSGEDFCKVVLEEARVALMSGGPAFLRPDNEFSVRLCFVGFDGKGALAESRRISNNTELPSDFVEKHCTVVYDGIMSLCDWVKKQRE